MGNRQKYYLFKVLNNNNQKNTLIDIKPHLKMDLNIGTCVYFYDIKKFENVLDVVIQNLLKNIVMKNEKKLTILKN